MAPEVIKLLDENIELTEQDFHINYYLADVFSLGLTFLYLATLDTVNELNINSTKL